jgi:transposase
VVFSTKIHAACDALGNTIWFILTGGEASDCAQALALLDGLKGSAVLADKGYDAAEAMGAEVVIPSKFNRKKSQDFNKKLYKERNLIELIFKKIKYFRRVANRCDKTLSAYLAFVLLSGICIWLK